MSKLASRPAPAAAAAVNRLLVALPGDEQARLIPDLETVELRRRQTLASPGEALTHVYFLGSGAVALLASGTEGLLDTGFVGADGLVALEAFYGVRTAQLQAVVMLPGVAQRLPLAAFARHAAPGTSLHLLIQRYAVGRMVQLSHSALCDATHSIRHRCIRRLLAFHDHARADHFPLTQQTLSALLGVRRASVSVAAEKLQGEGLILYEHGRMHIANRGGLEEAACPCYRSIQEQVGQLYSPEVVHATTQQ